VIKLRLSPLDFAADGSGNFATLAALVAPLAIVLGAVAIDSASLYQQRRETQALSDLAAITAAANLDHPEKAAITVLKDNGLRKISVVRGSGHARDVDVTEVDASLLLLLGRYRADGDTPIAERFVAGAKPYDAVKVTLTRTGQQYFSAAFSAAPSIGTSSIASAPAEAAFSIGSRLLRLDGGVLNAMLSGLTGSTISLSIMDYEALAAADIDVFEFSEALNSKLKLKAGTYTQVLDSQATVGQIASVIADINSGDRAGLAAAAFTRQTSGVESKIPLARLLSLGRASGLPLGSPPRGLTASVSALDLLSATAALSNGSRQVELNLGAKIPGLLSATAELAIGEPPQSSPWFTVGEVGDVVRTAQTRLRIVAEVAGPGGLIGASIKVPLYVELAFAEAKLTDIACSGKTRVKVAALPGVVALRIADVAGLADFRRSPSFTPATLVRTSALTVTGSAETTMTNLAPTTIGFSEDDITARTIKSVSTKDFTQSLTGSLLKNLQLDAKLAGLNLATPDLVGKSVGQSLRAATPAIDNLLDTVLGTLGVRLGEADVRVTGVTCQRAVLVQ
jgi:uncharacterized membrane protein